MSAQHGPLFELKGNYNASRCLHAPVRGPMRGPNFPRAYDTRPITLRHRAIHKYCVHWL